MLAAKEMIDPKLVMRNGELCIIDTADPLEPPVILAGDTLELGVEIFRRHFDFDKWARNLKPRGASWLHLQENGMFRTSPTPHHSPRQWTKRKP